MVEDGAQLQVLTYVEGNILSTKCAWNLHVRKQEFIQIILEVLCTCSIASLDSF